MDALTVLSAPFVFFLIAVGYKKCAASCLHFADLAVAACIASSSLTDEEPRPEAVPLDETLRQLFFFNK